MPYLTRPYALEVVRRNGERRVTEITIGRMKHACNYLAIAPVSRNTPRSGATYRNGDSIEFRYVDPRPGAPANITPAAQED